MGRTYQFELLSSLWEKSSSSLVVVSGRRRIGKSTLCSPALTTAHQPCDELAELAFELLESRQKNPSAPPRETFLSAPLVVRGSVRG